MKVAVVVDLPSAALSIAGFAAPNVTSAGPRCTAHVSTRSGRAGRPRPAALLLAGGRATFAENFAGLSVTHAVSVSGWLTLAASDAAMPTGGPVWAAPP